MQVTDCYSEPHMFVEVSELQPWVILSLNAGALKTTGETDPSFVSSRLPCSARVCVFCVVWSGQVRPWAILPLLFNIF